MIGVWQGHESDRKQVFRANLIRGHLSKTLPGRAARKLDANAVLDGFAARHRYALSRVIAQVVTLLEQSELPLHDLWLRGFHAGHDGGKALIDLHWHIAGRRLVRIWGQLRLKARSQTK